MKTNKENELFDKLNKFIQKYYLNILIKGAIYAFSLIIILFIVISIIEHLFQLNVIERTFLFWSYIALIVFSSTRLILLPFFQLLKIGKIISYRQAAKIIGVHFPEIDDKLLNVLELNQMNSKDNSLISASIDQKIAVIKPVKFNTAINLFENKKHLKWISIPVLIIVLFFISNKEYILTESSARILKHNTFFEPKPPFDFIIKNKLEVVQYTDWILDLELSGNEIPSSVFLNINNNSFQLKKHDKHNFSYILKNMSGDIDFYLSAGGYKSKTYALKTLAMPKLIDFSMFVDYPKYTELVDETIKNNGDLTIPEGTIINWMIKAQNTEKFCFIFYNDTITKQTNDFFKHKRLIAENTTYNLIIQNSHKLSDTLSYYITVVEDKFPEIDVKEIYDTINNVHLFAGEIRDDYLTNKLTFNYKKEISDSIFIVSNDIKINKLNKELFFYQFDFNSLNLKQGEEINYYFTVWDNDNVNGSKSTSSKSFFYKELSAKELLEKKELITRETKNSFNKSISITNELNKNIEEVKTSILQNQNLSWKDKQKINSLIEKQKKLENQIKKTKKNNKANTSTQEKLTPNNLEKQKKLTELINSMLNKEAKKILEELKKALEKQDKEKIKSLLEKLSNENSDLERELERELELFKQLELDQIIQDLVSNIQKLNSNQKDLLENTNSKKKNTKDLSEKQEELRKKMSDIQKSLTDLKNKNEELENKKNIPETKSLEEEIKEEMRKSEENLRNNSRNKSKKRQKNTIEKIEKLEDLIQNLQLESSSQEYIEDINSLRQILENLITLSFDQEVLISEVKSTQKNSSDFIQIIRKQKKLSDESKLIEDSLFALSKRVVQIKAVVNKEISSIKNNIKKITTSLEDRITNKAVEKQQFVLTSINNLSLLLSEILEQMQKDSEMPDSKCSKPKNCNKPKNCKKPSMSELKNAQLKLNQQMKKGKGKKKNERNAKELMELARQQEQIKKQLLDLRGDCGDKEKENIDKLIKNIEKNETDIINNKITEETIKRQEDILTRLIEAENSMRERKKEKTRESNEWLFTPDQTTTEYLKYFKQKEKHEELLETTPMQLKPYYKKKATRFFNSLITP